MRARDRILLAKTSWVSLGFLKRRVRILKDAGYEVHTSADLSAMAEDPKAYAPLHHVPMVREISFAKDMNSFVHALKLVRSLNPRVISYGTPKAALVMSITAFALRVPIRVYTMHGLRLEGTQGRKRELLILSEKITTAISTEVVCVSNSLRDEARHQKVLSREKGVVLGSGSVEGVKIVAPREEGYASSPLRRQLGIKEDDLVLIYAGRIASDKGIEELVNLFLEVQRRVKKNIKLILLGGSDESDPIKPSTATEIETNPSIVALGRVENVPDYLRISDIFIILTKREGISLAALEASACGLPVIASDVTGVRDAVVDGHSGWLIDTTQPSEAAEQLVSLLEDPVEMKRRGENGRRRVRDEFSPEDKDQQWLGLYQNLMHVDDLKRSNPTKRSLDVLVSLTALLVSGVPLLVLAAVVRARLGSPVIFQQQRPGLAGRPFTMYKFRTMTDERGPDGELLPDGVRLTPFGRFLRSTSLDELPGLFNVLRGDMSLVGPRPLLTRYTPYFTEEERQRLNVRPGITGWAQVNGRNTASWDDRLAMDVWYVQNQSLTLDLKILWMTVQRVLGRSGVVVDAESIMQNLDDERRGRLA